MPDLKPSPMLTMPQIILADEIESTLPLEHTDVTVQITGPVAAVMVVQRFGNPLKEAAELDYLFPLPEDAAITGFEIQVGQRRIDGSLQERETARDTYETAREQGKRAGLLEQRRPNLFAVRLANVQAGETILATMRYQQRLKLEETTLTAGSEIENVYEFVFPMGITPKFTSPEHREEGEGVHAPIAHAAEPVGPVEIQVSIDAGMAMGQPHSPSHSLNTVQIDERRCQVRLGEHSIPDHDFVLRYPLSGKEIQAGGWTSGEGKAAFFLSTLLPPPMDGEIQAPPREFIFVLDRSGSMTGEPIRQARNALRACLRSLNPSDQFRILLFDNVLEWFQPKPLAITQEQVELADHYLDQIQGRGGTEIVAALNAVLALPAEAQRTRYIVFLTDGAVSAEARVLEGIRSQLGSARLFTFGIGPSVNRALLRRMAEMGRGRSSFLQLDEDIEGAILQFQDSVSFPAITDLNLEWESGKGWDIYPARLPDLYYGQPLEISGRFSQNGSEPARALLRGKRAGRPVTVPLVLPQPAGQDRVVERLWARARIEALIEQMELEPARADKLRAEIIGLAVEFGLVTALTSFVAVDQQADAVGGKPRVIHVAQPLPQGLQPGGFTPGFQTMGIMGALPAAMSIPAAMRSPAAKTSAQAGPSFVQRLFSTAAKTIGQEPRRSIHETAGPVGFQPPAESVETPAVDRESVLRWLGRTQKLDGSWNEDIEWTAGALLAFVRAGHTTRAGSHRQALRRAARWLADHPGKGFARFVRARALEELAATTGDKVELAAASAARAEAGRPSSDQEAAASGMQISPPAGIHGLDDLRLAALLRTPLPVPPDLLQGKQADLARIWAASL